MYSRLGVRSAITNASFRLPDAPAEADLLAKYFRVLGDRTRLRVLELIAEHERVGAIIAIARSLLHDHAEHIAACRHVDATVR